MRRMLFALLLALVAARASALPVQNVAALSGIACMPNLKSLSPRPPFNQISATAPLLILPLGDSLTEGVPLESGVLNGGYRPELYRLLTRVGLPFRFVGSMESGPDDLPDKRHEGHGGWTIADVASIAAGVVARFHPDVVLLGAGGNDEVAGRDMIQAASELMALAESMAAAGPLVVVQTRPVRGDEFENVNERFNERLRALVALAGPPVYLADNNRCLLGGDLLGDLRHPTVEGNRKLAEGWFEALEPVVAALVSRRAGGSD